MAVLTRLFGVTRLTWRTWGALASHNSPGGYAAQHPPRQLNSFAINGRIL